LIDKIRLSIRGAKANPAYIKDWRKQDTNTGTGHLGNMKVSQNIGGVSVIGSIAKYLNGENMTALSLKEVEAAVKKLETETGISLKTAIVTQLEVGKTCIVKECPSEYMRLFGYLPRYGKHLYYNPGGMLETVGYSTPEGSYSLTIYDKAVEMRRHRAEIPELFEGCNCLRVEYGIDRRRGIKARFGHDLTAYHLFDYETYRRLQMLFLQRYKAVPKTGRLVYVDKAKNITPAELKKRVAAAFRETHPDQYRASIQVLREAKKLSDKNHERIREEERRQGKDSNVSDTSPLIDELDNILELAVKCVV
jgi:hypothetical protein